MRCLMWTLRMEKVLRSLKNFRSDRFPLRSYRVPTRPNFLSFFRMPISLPRPMTNARFYARWTMVAGHAGRLISAGPEGQLEGCRFEENTGRFQGYAGTIGNGPCVWKRFGQGPAPVPKHQSTALLMKVA